jgi:hypothetical protein
MTADGFAPDAGFGTLAVAALALRALPAQAPALAEGWNAAMLAPAVAALRAAPAAQDRRLVAVAEALALTDAELMAVALCRAAETDGAVARAVAEAQSGLGGSRPLLGLAASVLEPLGATVAGLGCGGAIACGLLQLGEERAALPERSLVLPLPLLAALEGRAMALDSVRIATPPAIPLTAATREGARLRGRLLGDGRRAGLVIRSASPAEALAVAGEVAAALGQRLARIEAEPPAGLAPWLIAADCLPVFMPRPGPGERWALPALAPYDGPWILLPGLDGAVEAEAPPDEWILPVPAPAERVALWRDHGVPEEDAARAGAAFRQGAGRIAEAAARARLAAARAGRAAPGWPDVTAGVAGNAATLDALARRSADRVEEDALVLPASLRAALHGLLARAELRGRLSEGLGPAIAARDRPGLRALLVGESGTGKTLAAHWLATRLGLPLYRVDLAALTSKWIGETEKNLSAILGAAEHADVLLFFDEADALFAARTDVGDANDRFANAQTNYLLQRIEEFDGIALLASNSRERFDPAFVRRLDAILDFPLPEAPARRALWDAHLGAAHDLPAEALDRLAVSVDLAGGHIRNVVLAAAARAKAEARRIGWPDVTAAIAEEYAKLARPSPDLPPWA